MMFTDLTYTQIGEILGATSLLFFTAVVAIRFVLAFRNYIYSGNFGDFEKSAFAEMMSHGNFFSRYAFIGYHPGILMIDAVTFGVFSLLIIPFWGAYIVIGLFLLLGNIVRKRIAIKQEFVAKLDGTHDE